MEESAISSKPHLIPCINHRFVPSTKLISSSYLTSNAMANILSYKPYIGASPSEVSNNETCQANMPLLSVKCVFEYHIKCKKQKHRTMLAL